MNDLSWYVVQSHPAKEALVRERIADLEREVFLPLVRERVAGQSRPRLAPLFPGYLFARLSHDAGDLARVRWSPGVRRLLGDGAHPSAVDDRVVDCIRRRTDPEGRLRVGRRLRQGDRVRIVDGPLAGLIGVLDRPVHGPEQRVAVLLEVFRRLTRVVVPARAVWSEARA